jgi:carboxyl-terminal processing protease
MKFLNKPIGAILFVLLLLSSHSGLLGRVLQPNSYMEGESRWVVRCLQGQHYLNETVDEMDLSEFVVNYIKELDNQKLFFYKEEVEQLNARFGLTIKTYLEKGNLYPAFEIYNLFEEKTKHRLDWALSRLDEPFSFLGDEMYEPDRKDQEWAMDTADADRIWDLKLKYELLNRVLREYEDLDPAKKEKNEDESDDNGSKKVEDLAPLPPLEEYVKIDLEGDRYKEAYKIAVDGLKKRYERFMKTYEEYEAGDIQDIYLNVLTQMYDPHSTFLSSDSLEDFNISMKNSFVGIGAVLQSDDGYCVIKELIPGGPAEGSKKLNPTDVIMGVAQGKEEFVDVVEMKLRKIVKLIKGPKNTEVRLSIKPGDAADPSERKIVSLIRDEIKLTANLAKASIIQVPKGNKTVSIGVIDLPSFYSSYDNEDTESSGTTHDVEELIYKLKDAGVEGMILDLRFNGGGILEQAVHLTGLFIPKGPVVQVRDTNGSIRNYMDHDPKVAWDGPLMVLISKYSASASEIVAGALQDHHRAIIVGDSSTHGKGTVQAIFPMNIPFLQSLGQKAKQSATKVTIRKFYLPSGHSTQIKGVKSDISLVSANEFLPIAEGDLPNALEWDQIKPISWFSYDKNGKMKVDDSILNYLKEKSVERQSKLEEFDYMKRSIDWLKKQREIKLFSLNIYKRLEEKYNEQKFRRAMDEELEHLDDKAYEQDKVLLNVSLEQEEKYSSGEDVSEKDEDPAFDIRLREGARIMADWLEFLEKNSSSSVVVETAGAVTDHS